MLSFLKERLPENLKEVALERLRRDENLWRNWLLRVRLLLSGGAAKGASAASGETRGGLARAVGSS